MRDVTELSNVRRPAWPALYKELRRAKVPVDIRPVDPELGRQTLHRIQVTVGSRLGAMAWHTGGLLVDHGWLRVLGGGDPGVGLVDLATANGLEGEPAAPSAILVGFDVLGGRFEINGANPAAIERPGSPGELCYFAPEKLQWQSLGLGHGDWLSWLAAGNTTLFYADVRWPGWEEEVHPLSADRGLAVYPFLFTREAKSDLAATHRSSVPMTEVFDLNAELAAQMRQLPAGTTFRVTSK